MPRWKRGKGEQWPAAYRNNITFQYYYNLLKSLAMCCFEWHNLPLEIDERFLELTLFETGMAVFFKDEILEGYVALTTEIEGPLNVYRIPMRRRAYAPNGYNVVLNSDNSVLIFNNLLHTNMVNDIMVFAIKLADIDMTIQTNVKAQKTPMIIRTTQEQQLVLKNFYEQYEGNVPFIFADSKFQMNPLEVLKTDAPFVAEELQFLKMQIYSEALAYLGIESDPSLKKERLVADEISNSMGNVLANRYNRLKARNQACDMINKMFGLDIYVTYSAEFVSGKTGETTGFPSDELMEVEPNE